jgi:hypothetical protein
MHISGKWWGGGGAWHTITISTCSPSPDTTTISTYQHAHSSEKTHSHTPKHPLSLLSSCHFYFLSYSLDGKGASSYPPPHPRVNAWQWSVTMKCSTWSRSILSCGAHTKDFLAICWLHHMSNFAHLEIFCWPCTFFAIGIILMGDT